MNTFVKTRVREKRVPPFDYKSGGTLLLRDRPADPILQLPREKGLIDIEIRRRRAPSKTRLPDRWDDEHVGKQVRNLRVPINDASQSRIFDHLKLPAFEIALVPKTIGIPQRFKLLFED